MPFKKIVCIHTNKFLYLFDFTCANAKHLQGLRFTCTHIQIHARHAVPCSKIRIHCARTHMHIKGWVTSIDFFTPFHNNTKNTACIRTHRISSSPINNFGLFFWYCDFYVFQNAQCAHTTITTTINERHITQSKKSERNKRKVYCVLVVSNKEMRKRKDSYHKNNFATTKGCTVCYCCVMHCMPGKIYYLWCHSNGSFSSVSLAQCMEF